jgi:DNA-binding phage protein
MNKSNLLIQLLREIAETKGISQLMIAKRTGLKQSNISIFFNFKRKPNLDTFLQVAEAVGVNFFFEDRDRVTDLNQLFEKAMEDLGRRPDKLSKN